MKTASKIGVGIAGIILFFCFIITSFMRILIDNPSTIQGSKYARMYQRQVYNIATSKGFSHLYEIFLSIMIEESNTNRTTPNKMGAGYDATTDPNGFYAGIDQFQTLYTYAQNKGITDLYHVVQAYHFENIKESIVVDEDRELYGYLDYITPTAQYSEELASNYITYVKEYMNESKKEIAREEYNAEHPNGCDCHKCDSCNYLEILAIECPFHMLVPYIPIVRCDDCTYISVFVSRCDGCNARVAADADTYADNQCPIEDIIYEGNALYADSVCSRTSYNLGYIPGSGDILLPEQGEGTDIIISNAFYYMSLGVPYVSPGSHPPFTFDCSSFTNYIYGKAGISIPMVAYLQYNQATRFHDMAMAEPGDLVFFKDTRTDGELRIAEDGTNITHVGVYIGNGKFIHASSGEGKVIQSSFTSYYQQHFAAFGRF